MVSGCVCMYERVVLMTHLLLHAAANSEHFHEAGFDAYCCGYGELCHMMSHDVT